MIPMQSQPLPDRQAGRLSAASPAGRPVGPGGFTLIELLVVIAIIGVVTSIMLPALGAVRRRARQGVCLSHLHQLGLASTMYLNENKETVWPYFQNVSGGRKWWFGFEPGGPGSGANRPLDKSRSVLAPYLSTTSDTFQCPTFPYEDSEYFPKFDRHGASYGFNVRLANDRLAQYAAEESSVFLFADAIHFDFNPGFNEGHYITHNANAAMASGYAHFRHQGAAQAVMLDGHAAAQTLDGPAFTEMAGGEAGNLVAHDGSDSIYGR